MTAHTDSVAVAATKVTPPLAVGGSILAGVSLSDVVLVLAGVYSALQIGFLLYDRWGGRHGRK